MSLVQNEMPGKTQAPTASADPAHALETTQQSTDSGAIPEPKGPGGSHHATFSFLKTLNYCPPNCRWDNDHPRPLSWGLCLLFAFAGAFTVANLYYSHPILNILAEDFNIAPEKASQIPTLMQAGYAAGLLFLCPLGDILPTRPLVLLLVFVTANIWLGLCITTSFSVFQALSCLAAVTTVTPQVILPLVAFLAVPERRATMISIIAGGLFTGILLARVLSGVITEYASWRIVYWMSFGVQYLLLAFLFLFLPDYPAVNKSGNITYFRILYTIFTIPLRQPILVQTSMQAFFVAAVFVSYWTVLTFLLSSTFHFSTLAIGLFALVGLPPFLINPFLSSHVTDRYHPAHSAIIAIMIAMVGVVVGTFVGTFSLAGPVVQGLLVDLGFVMSQTANRSQLAVVEPSARNRINTVYTVSTFCGMLMGTAVGNNLYAEGGWHYSGGASIAFLGAALIVGIVRGPHETGWVGWKGGWSWKKEKIVSEEQGSR